MAAFVAKQLVGDKMKSVTGALDDKKEEGEGDGKTDEEAAEIEEMRREAEEKRKEKHRKMEEERETMRQSIRDKYGLKKKEVLAPAEDPDLSGRLGRKKKTPAEMAAEANADSDDEDLQSKGGFPTNLDELSTKVTDLKNNVATSVSEVTEKCTVQ